MKRFFNTAGPVKQQDHYIIDPLTRIDLNKILSLVEQEKYFVLHAPRQTGKTSYLFALMDYINKEGKYRCLYMNAEMAQAARENVIAGIRTTLNVMAAMADDYLHDPFLKNNWEQILDKNGEFSALYQALKQWAKQSPKPLVLLIDEIDALIGDTLISVLRQLRAGYAERPAMFPQSIVLCGVRDVKDYRIHSDKEKSMVTGGSAFNVKAESLRLDYFTIDDIRTLYCMHTTDTGQEFEEDVFPLLWELTEGQPWLVNALGYEVCFNMDGGKDRKRAITRAMIMEAKENLILRRETHLDQLADKLSEARVARVIQPILSGSHEAEKIPADDVNYVMDLGLVKKDRQVRIANRIYREVIPREITYSTQLTIHQEAPWYTGEDGRLDMEKLLDAFQGFFRKHFESWVDGFDYAEAGPQLLLQAFLQRIVNGGGQVEREYGLGRQRTDLLVIWPYKTGVQQAVIELKLKYSGLEKTVEEGLEQTRGYMDKCGTDEGYLLVFDRSTGKTWEEKIFKEAKTVDGVPITVYGM